MHDIKKKGNAEDISSLVVIELCIRCPHDPKADINDDPEIDMVDIGIVAKNFGHEDP